jgi:hypothetical protein
MNVEHERALHLRNTLHRPQIVIDVPWRTYGLLARAIFFVLTCVGLGAVRQLFELFGVPAPGLFLGLAALGLAEYLIRDRRWFWTGIEEALWLGGTVAMVSELPRSGRAESLLVIAAACGIPGWRVRNPLFGAVAAAFVTAYFEKRFDLGVVAALALAAIAVLALLRTWQRPSNEWLWILIALLLPAVGRFYADGDWRNVTIALYLLFGLSVLALAIVKRHHALFFSGGIALAIAAGDVIALANAPLELMLAIAGGLLLMGSWITARLLRDRRTGFVTTPSKFTAFDDELEVAATISLPQQDFDQRMESGGEFGGAGATGKY